MGLEVEALERISASNNLFDLFLKISSTAPSDPVYWSCSDSTGKKLWSEHSFRSVNRNISILAQSLINLGVKPGDKIAILSNTRPEWCLADMAIIAAGAITVSIYQSLPASEVGYILHDSEANFIFVENQEQLQKIEELVQSEFCIPDRENRGAYSAKLNSPTVISFESVESQSFSVTKLSDLLSNQEQEIDPYGLPGTKLIRSEIASIVYTSGTTGPPKGVVQEHGHHLANVYQATKSGVFGLDGSLFLYLPLAHSFARLIYYLGFLTPAKLVFPSIADRKSSRIDLQAVASDMRQAGAHIVPSVPRLFEKIAITLATQASGPSLKARILRLTLDNAKAIYKTEGISVFSKVLFRLLSPIRTKIKKQIFGDGFKHAISGGAKLEPNITRFFDSLGITILEGYGLTETCVATNVNLPGKQKIGSVGLAFEGVEVKIDEQDGEILFKGPNITKQYYNRPMASAEAWTENGWFRTGDIGSVDADGFLYIIDRKKDLIVTAGGKKIPPQAIESRLKASPFISQALMFGDGKPYCVALISINAEPVRLWFAENEPSVLTSELALEKHSAVRELLQREIKELNQHLASFEEIKKFAILPEDLSVENGFLTPTMKVKRKPVFKKYANLIDELYN